MESILTGLICLVIAIVLLAIGFLVSESQDIFFKGNEEPYKHKTREYKCVTLSQNAYGFGMYRTHGKLFFRHALDVYGRLHSVSADDYMNVSVDYTQETFLEQDKYREWGNINRRNKAIEKGQDWYWEYFFHWDDKEFIVRLKEISTNRHFGVGIFSNGALRKMGVSLNTPCFKLYYEPQIHEADWGVGTNELDLIPHKDKMQFMTRKELETLGFDAGSGGFELPYADPGGNDSFWLHSWLH